MSDDPLKFNNVLKLAAVPPGLPPAAAELKPEDIEELHKLIKRLEEKRVLGIGLTYAWMNEDGKIQRLRLWSSAEGQIVYLCGLVALLNKRVQTAGENA